MKPSPKPTRIQESGREPRHFKTPNGKHSSLCHSCGRIVYNLWVTDEPPPLGCCEGHDAQIWKCGTVYNACVSIVIRLDHLKKPLVESQQELLRVLGSHGDKLLAHIRSGALPPGHEPKEPTYGMIN